MGDDDVTCLTVSCMQLPGAVVEIPLILGKVQRNVASGLRLESTLDDDRVRLHFPLC